MEGSTEKINSNLFDLKDLRILAVDDNKINNVVICELLKNTGAVADTALNAADAEKLLAENSYDIIFLDHIMPEVDGITLLKTIREKHLCDRAPAVALTANDVTGARENYLKAGFADYIPKPVNRKILLNTIVKNVKGIDIEAMEGKKRDDIKKPCALIVDDNEINLKIAHKFLEDKVDTVCKNSGASALEYLSESHPDIILLDLHMPEVDGFEILEKITKSEELKDIPVVCLTADNDRESELRCFQLGAQDFIVKPFIAEIMRQRVFRILELNNLQKHLKSEISKEILKSDQRRRQLELLTVQTMRALAGTIDAKDKYTNGHSARVADYSREIAKRLNMSQKEQQDIYYMGLLHDIGKIGIPDEIINKTSRLNDEEYAVIKTHPVIGSDILKKISAMPNITTGARWHHERYDGKGYPDGLKGEEIPAVARIIGVADAYDAMTSNRSYRNILPQEVVRNEILKGLGSQFDPVFGGIMLKIIDDDKDYLLRASI